MLFVAALSKTSQNYPHSGNGPKIHIKSRSKTSTMRLLKRSIHGLKKFTIGLILSDV
jgi:hypothetical protein